MSAIVEKWEQDAQWLRRESEMRGIQLDDDQTEAFCERVSILCGQGMDEQRARTLAARRFFG